MILFAGLGNPGSQYRQTRHNIGFMAVEAICRYHHFAQPRQRFQGELSEGRMGGDKALGFLPQTYMNLSGQAIGKAMRYFDVPPEDVVVFYDELDLPLGKLRVRAGGGSGGHNGIRSVITHCGVEFRRVRLGIGHPGDKTRVNRHVLGAFSKTEMGEIVQPWLAAIAEHATLLDRREDDLFANKLHLAMEAHLPD